MTLSNPIITSIIASKLKQEPKTIVTGRTKSDVELEIFKAESKRKNINTIAKGTGILVGAFILYKGAKLIIKNKTEKDQSPQVQYAKKLRVAMFPSGTTWMPDGTNEQAIMKVAYKIANNTEISFSDVQKAYKKLYNDSLSVHLQKELNSSEYEALLQVISNNYSPEKDTENPEYYANGKMIIMTKSTSLYKDLYDVFESQNLKAKSFFINAVTTGNTKKVAFVGYFNKQTRIQIKIVNKSKTVWLNADGIITVPRTKENLLKYKNAGYKMYNLK